MSMLGRQVYTRLTTSPRVSSGDADEGAEREDNPALDFLKRACALFATEPTESGGDMKCPYCSAHSADVWQKFFIVTDSKGTALAGPNETINEDVPALPGKSPAEWIKPEWMKCHNPACGHIIIRITYLAYDMSSREQRTNYDAWFALPRKSAPRPVDPLVPANFAKDYAEASLILADSHRMSAVLSRRILSDLLKQYANRTEKILTNQIDTFLKDPAHSVRVKENLHYLREMGNYFGAHTQTDKSTDEIIDATPEEAEWTLTVVDGLFDYFIVGPERDKQLRASFDAKLKRAVGTIEGTPHYRTYAGCTGWVRTRDDGPASR